jgi:uncharacterized protein (TIGR00290 family)
MIKKVLFNWSGGKDSAMALYELKKDSNYEVVVLLTTVTDGYDRISMHGVRNTLLEQQARSLGFSLEKVCISKKSSNEEYEAKMKDLLLRYQVQGVSLSAFGDIFLEDLRKYREKNLLKIGLKGIFPLWKRNTAELARAFVDLGFKAVITCVDSKYLDKSFVGRVFNKEFLADLPPGVDPCGENGEFHSFVYDGPILKSNIIYERGEVVLRDNRFYYCDLLPIDKTGN